MNICEKIDRIVLWELATLTTLRRRLFTCSRTIRSQEASRECMGPPKEDLPSKKLHEETTLYPGSVCWEWHSLCNKHTYSSSKHPRQINCGTYTSREFWGIGGYIWPKTLTAANCKNNHFRMADPAAHIDQEICRPLRANVIRDNLHN